MMESPIIMSGESVAAILDGRKSQTRRVVARANSLFDGVTVGKDVWGELDWEDAYVDPGPSPAGNRGPYLKVARPADGSRHRIYPRLWSGDRLWVRESGWQPKEASERELREGADTWPRYAYDADGISDAESEEYREWGWKRRSPIHMPRWASRLTLELTRVRVERVQAITAEDCSAEGVRVYVGEQEIPPNTSSRDDAIYRDAFARRWNEINGARGFPWKSSCWVWVYDFVRATP